jgi:hypothetical protein
MFWVFIRTVVTVLFVPPHLECTAFFTHGCHKEMSSILADQYALVDEPKCGGWGWGCGVPANEYSCAHGAQINFGDPASYLTYGLSQSIERKTCTHMTLSKDSALTKPPPPPLPLLPSARIGRGVHLLQREKKDCEKG